MKTAIVTLVLCACSVSADDAERSNSRFSATSLTARATSGDTGSTSSAPGPGVLSGEETYRTSQCPVPGNDPGLVIPAASMIQALACDESDYGLICHLAPELVVSVTIGTEAEIFLVSCEEEELYVIRWIAPTL